MSSVFGTVETGFNAVFEGKIDTGSEEQWKPFKDGKTHLWIEIDENNLQMYTYLMVERNKYAYVDWGDGTVNSVLGKGTLNQSQAVWVGHLYEKTGKYIISIYADDDITVVLGGKKKTTTVLYFSNGYTNNVLKYAEVAHFVNDYGFYDNDSLRRVYITNGCGGIYQEGFEQCFGLEKIEFEERDSYIQFYGANIFQWCDALKEFEFPTILRNGQIPANCLYNCYALSKIIMHDGVTSIADNAIANIYAINEVTIPASVTSLGTQFKNCSHLMKIRMLGETPPTVGTLTLQTKTQIVVPAGRLETYQTAEGWSAYASKMIEEETT